MSISGTYECVTKSPMGEQKSNLTIVADGDSFTGTNAGPMGSVDIADGKIDGNTLTWSMKLTSPMPMTLEGKATVDGDSFAGTEEIVTCSKVLALTAIDK
ncbi:MAG: hypothetical protein IH997_11735, partial [Proteobacteria bacterium]|nr:hypothetical protein [Pseudomonadota bacterium]